MSPWGEVQMIHELSLKSEFKQRIDSLDFHLPGVHREFDPVDVIEGSCLESMWAAENEFRWVVVAHSLMSLFRLTLLRERKHIPRKSTINFQCIAIGSYLARSARKTALRLCPKGKRKEFIEGLFKPLSGISLPFRFSNE